jgi:hypothetical protein
MTLMEKRLFGVHSDVFPLGSFPSGHHFPVTIFRSCLDTRVRPLVQVGLP